MLVNNSHLDMSHFVRHFSKFRWQRSSIGYRFSSIVSAFLASILLVTLLYKTFMEFKGCAKPKVSTSGLHRFPKEQLWESLPNAFHINICSLLSCAVKYAPLSYPCEIHELFASKLILPHAPIFKTMKI